MMNSMNNLTEEIKRYVMPDNIEEIDSRELAIDLQKSDVFGALSFLKKSGFTQLCLLTCIDWIKTNEFQLVYILFNWETGIHILVRTMLDRDNPEFTTITEIFAGAQYYEREVHEFFGVKFEGNEDSSKPLFLELWDDMPPLRKDFDPQEYSDKKFPKREHSSHFESVIRGDAK